VASRDGRGFGGAAIGIGAAAIGLGIFFVSRRASAASTGSPREWPPSRELPPPSRTGRFSPLVERWRTEVARRSKDLPVDAILEWIRIESGGDMCSVGAPS
jgi:hypothetical protein